MDFTKTIINAVKIWVNKQLSFIENKISDLENRPSAFIQPEEPSETPDGTLWIDTDEDSISGVGSNTAESLTFTGVVEATYNGLSPVTVNIPKVTVNGVTSDENGNIEIEVGSEQVQTDWNQNDSTQPDYIKNRTHWIEGSTYHALNENFIPETIARTSAVEEIKTLVGETPVSEQISEAVANVSIAVDSELSSESENPVQNKVVNEAISNLSGLVGNVAVSEQIEAAIAEVEIPVVSVNGQIGDVVIEIPSVDGLATETYVDNIAENIRTSVDSELNSTSENPVKNKVVNEAISNLSALIGDASVSEQIEFAISKIPEQVQPDWNQNDNSAVDYIKNKPEITLDRISLVDHSNGYKYHLYMNNGELIIQTAYTAIEVTTMPTKNTYWTNEEFDPSGMLVSAIYPDGTKVVVNDYTYEVTGNIGEVPVIVSYTEYGVTYTTTFNITFDIQDFTYTVNEDGNITLDTWKGTLNGEPSTNCVIPRSNGIIKVKI